MSVFNSDPPKIKKNHLILWLKDNYIFLKDKNLNLQELNGERDKNYLLIADKKEKFIIKVSNTLESKKLLEMQDNVLILLSKKKYISKFVPKKIHTSIKIYKDKFQRPSYVRILSFIKGNMFAYKKQSNLIDISLGKLLGYMSKGLQNFSHPSAYRKFEWDPSSIEWTSKYLNFFSFEKKKIIQNNLIEYKNFIKLNKINLRHSVTHGDPNNYNIVVHKNNIVGLLDYGDMIFAPTINDLSISLAYALMNKKNLFLSLKNIITNYHNVFPITSDEIFSLMTLVKCRLTITVVMASLQRKKFPNNKYLSISEKDAWNLLYKLDKINPYVFIYLIRYFCGLKVIKNYESVIKEIQNTKFYSILGFNINDKNKSIIKLNYNSKFSKYSNSNKVEKQIKSYLINNNSKIGIGLYCEKRNVYKGNNYLSLFNIKKRRNFHIGIDIFADVGTQIYAPISGKVIIAKNNNSKFDYGPTIVLEHKLNNNKFYTLYGHLSKSSLKKIKVGMIIKKGISFSKIGNFIENGNWSPHLHFQIILDLMNENKNFPGVVEEDLLPIWKKISPNPNLILKIPNTFFQKNETNKKIFIKRKSLISPNFSIAHNSPMQILESKGQYLFNEKGRRFLDCVNNISHVGHSHPKIHEALTMQNLKLNTNTRYLYKIINDYSEKLLSTLPKKLNTIFFVCTGSEANDLAYRISKTFNGNEDVIVIDNAYHGHTNKLIDISPYKFNGKGGKGKKEFVHVASMPDGIRGEWLYSNKNWINEYINQFKSKIDIMKFNKRSLSCFFTESILGCGGQIILPPNYLKETFKIIRRNNGLCIVDEVQTGFGRVGNNFWAFEEHGVVPDILTIGKPMGNGHPIGAVITTKEIAKKFNNGMEYFNSFGGNPVSCSVGNAVLQVIEEENLQEHGKIVGNYFLNLLKKIQKKYPQRISEVRGRGLFLGIDLINEKNNLPDSELTLKMINCMRNNGILISSDGPHSNVLKIKPPMPFNKKNCDYFIEIFENNISLL